MLDKINDDTVLISQPFWQGKRFVGVTSDQYWYEGTHSSNNSIHFTKFGQAEIVQVMDSRDKYVCEYHLIDGFLLLEIKSMTTHYQNVKEHTTTFSPALKTFLRVRIEENVVYVEHVDLKTLLNNKREWAFENNAFHILQSAIQEDEAIPFDEYHRIK